MKVDILAFGAHPDDIELSCGGTIIRHVQAGKKVAVIDLTGSELSTRGNVETRTKEAAKALKLLGITDTPRENLLFSDGFFQNDREHQLEVVKKIRQYRPEIVLCNAIEDRHPDHGKGSKLVSDACFLAGLPKVQTTIGTQKQKAWRVKAVYHYIQDRYIRPDFIIDISQVIEQKMKAVLAFKSQFYNPDSKEPETPISSKEFINYLYGKASMLGRSIGVEYAEGFTVERTPGVDSLFDLI